MKHLLLVRTFTIICLLALFAISCKENDTDNIISVTSSDTINDITQTSAVVNSIITADAGTSITARGVCWSMGQLPTVQDNKTTDGSGTGSFTSTINGLEANTEYTVRAYASGTAGTTYGNVLLITTLKPFPVNGSIVKDGENNSYHTLIIGNQVWLKENLKVSNYRNGDPLLDLTDSTTWNGGYITTGGYSNYNNDTAISNIYGKLYNWYAINDSRGICPAGWHIPTVKEWNELAASLGGNAIAGGKLKESGTANWQSPNMGATNESGFTALPAGFRELDGTFQTFGIITYMWSSTDTYAFGLGYNQIDIGSILANKPAGFSVRCIMDK
jgi:uncharacterized protein (TIGR02145 family)